MSKLRLGVATAVLDGEGQVLLSRRGDLGIWNLPTGRLDTGETIAYAAAREAREETGIDVELQRAVGLYYQHGRSRMNVLFQAAPAGGTLKTTTDESSENAFMSTAALPTPFFGDFMVRDVLAGGTHLFVLETPPKVLRKVQRQLAWRYVKNLLSGRPEPRWATFQVQASLAVLDRSSGAVLALPHIDNWRVLPGCAVNGDTPPWEQVRRQVRDDYGVYELRTAELRWVGLYENVTKKAIEFVFAAEVQPGSLISDMRIAWTPLESSRWWGGYGKMVKQLLSANEIIFVLE